MELSRRHAVVGAAVAIAGCSELRSGVDDRADGVFGPGEHPFAGATTIAVVDRSDSKHDLVAVATEAARYWNDNAAEYAGFEVSFTVTTESPDVELVFLGRRENLEGCQEHSSSDILGCSPLLTAEHRPERPVTVEVVAADRPYGDVRITAKHELGHALGLGHDDDPAHVMSKDIADRLPAYGRRLDVLDAFENAWSGRNAGTRKYNRGINRWNDGEYERAVPTFESAAERYRTASKSVETAVELEAGFDGMARPDTVDREALTESARRAREWLELAAERSALMADSSSARAEGDVSEARAQREGADAARAELRTIDFPAPIDVADALGLVRNA